MLHPFQTGRVRGAVRGLRLMALALVLALAGCSSRQMRLFHPAGPVAAAQLRFMIIDVLIMALIIVPTGVFVAVCIWRYRVTRRARFDGDFTHSVKLEILMWGVPFAAVAALAFFSWQGVYRVDPYAPSALARGRPLLAVPPKPGRAHPLVIDVVATDWQWLFIYPDQHIATLNTLYVPVGRNIEFRLTSTDAVNDFFIPQLIGMIDVMPGMRTVDVMRADHPGVWRGFSADISGPGFSWMQFETHVLTPEDYATWLAKAGSAPDHLSEAQFGVLARPTINLRQRTTVFSQVAPHLFRGVVAAAQRGKVYATPMFLTKEMAKDKAAHAGYLAGYPRS